MENDALFKTENRITDYYKVQRKSILKAIPFNMREGRFGTTNHKKKQLLF